MSPSARERLALVLAALVVLLAVGVVVQSRVPDEVDRVTERVMLRLQRSSAPPAASGGTPSATHPECVPETVVDDYGFDVVITECEDPAPQDPSPQDPAPGG